MATGFGVIGCGMIANFHAKAIGDIRGASVAACFDMFPAAADRFAEQQGCTAYHELDAMLADPAVDVVRTEAGDDEAVRLADRLCGSKQRDQSSKRCQLNRLQVQASSKRRPIQPGIRDECNQPSAAGWVEATCGQMDALQTAR